MKENPKTSDHHFKKMSEYKYTLEFVEPRKSDLEKIRLFTKELEMENKLLKKEKKENIKLIEDLIYNLGIVTDHHKKVRNKIDKINKILN